MLVSESLMGPGSVFPDSPLAVLCVVLVCARFCVFLLPCNLFTFRGVLRRILDTETGSLGDSATVFWGMVWLLFLQPAEASPKWWGWRKSGKLKLGIQHPTLAALLPVLLSSSGSSIGPRGCPRKIWKTMNWGLAWKERSEHLEMKKNRGIGAQSW